MESTLRPFFEPSTWIGALVIAILAIFVAPIVPRTLKATILWIPRRIGRFFAAFWQHFKTMSKGKTDPIAALSYVGRQLGLLIMYAFLCIVSLGFIATLQIIDAPWVLSFHKWFVIVAGVSTIVSIFRGGSIVLLLVFFCEMITNPPQNQENKPLLKLGKFELGPFDTKPTVVPSAPKPTHQTPPPTYEQNDGDAGKTQT